MSFVKKPDFPKNCSGWWKKRMDELTEEQQQIKREYYRQYNAWKKGQQSPIKEEINSPEVSPEEELEIIKEQKKEHRKEYQRKYYYEKMQGYFRGYHKKRYAEDPEYVQRCKKNSKKQAERAKRYNELVRDGAIVE